MGQNLDINYVRSLFPAFSEKELAGKAFFENAGGSYTSSFVIDRLLRFYKSRKVQPYGYHPTSELAGMEMDEARFEMIDRNKDRALQQKRISPIIQVSGLLGVNELHYIKKQIEDMITDIERKEDGK